MDYNFSFSLCQGVFQKNSRIRCEFCFLLIYDSVRTVLCLGNPTRYSLIVKLTLHFYVYAPLRSVQNIHWMFCTISGGSLSLKTTPVQAHRSFRLLTLASSYVVVIIHSVLPLHQIFQGIFVHHTANSFVQFFPQFSGDAGIFPAAGTWLCLCAFHWC